MTARTRPQWRTRPNLPLLYAPPHKKILRCYTAQKEHVYVLTLLTDNPHHARMTALRNKYFPKHLNKLSAHLTLFHALPDSRLDTSVIPVIQDVANETSCFDITAATPFKLGNPPRGIGIAIPHDRGGSMAKKVRDRLLLPWKEEGFLSKQDAVKTEKGGKGRGTFPHYTLMNKVDDEAEVQRAWEELEREFDSDKGIVEGLGLYRYDRGWWRWVRGFDFVAPKETEKGDED